MFILPLTSCPELTTDSLLDTILTLLLVLVVVLVVFAVIEVVEPPGEVSLELIAFNEGQLAASFEVSGG